MNTSKPDWSKSYFNDTDVHPVGHLLLPRLSFLVVEDDFVLQPIWESIIHRVDPRAIVRWARTGEGAEELMQKWSERGSGFDFIIADVTLAGEKTGIDLWRRYRDDETLFLFETSLTVRKFSQMLGEREAPSVVHKPLHLNECVEAIRTMLLTRDGLAEKEEQDEQNEQRREYLQ